MITSTSTALNDLNFIQQFSDQPNIMNDLTVQLMEKYGNRENFLNSVRKEQESASVQTNLPETEMLNEAKQTFRDVGGDAGIAESMSTQLPEGTRFQDNIGNIGKFIDRSDKKLPTSEDFTEEGFLKRPFVGLMPDFERMKRRKERKEADRETGLEALEFGKTNPLEAYAAGLIDKSDLSLADQARVLGDDFQDMMADMNRKKQTAKALGMNVGLLGLKEGQESELAKRQEIIAMAERMNPGDPDAGRKALDEYLLGQKTKLDDSKKDIYREMLNDFNFINVRESSGLSIVKDLVDKGYSDPYADEPSDMDTERPDDEPEDEVPGDNAPDDKPKEGGAKSISDEEFEKLNTFGDYSYKTTDNYQTAEDDNMMGSVRSSIYKDIIKKTGVDEKDFIDIAAYYDEEDYDTLGDYYDDLMKQAKEDKAKETKGESFLKKQLERFGGLK